MRMGSAIESSGQIRRGRFMPLFEGWHLHDAMQIQRRSRPPVHALTRAPATSLPLIRRSARIPVIPITEVDSRCGMKIVRAVAVLALAFLAVSAMMGAVLLLRDPSG